MKKLSMCLTAVMLVICAGTAFIAFSDDGFLGGIVRGAGNVATSAAVTLADTPQNLIEGKPLIQGQYEDPMVIEDELEEDELYDDED